MLLEDWRDRWLRWCGLLQKREPLGILAYRRPKSCQGRFAEDGRREMFRIRPAPACFFILHHAADGTVHACDPKVGYGCTLRACPGEAPTSPVCISRTRPSRLDPTSPLPSLPARLPPMEKRLSSSTSPKPQGSPVPGHDHDQGSWSTVPVHRLRCYVPKPYSTSKHLPVAPAVCLRENTKELRTLRTFPVPVSYLTRGPDQLSQLKLTGLPTESDMIRHLPTSSCILRLQTSCCM